MATVNEARYGLTWNFVTGDSGWGDSFNTHVRLLGAFLHCYLLSDSLLTPPTTPTDGDAYFVPATGATGAWSSHGSKVAAWQAGAWYYFNIPTGLRAYIASRAGFFWFVGGGFTAEPSVITGALPWANLPAEAQSLPIPFVIPGKPPPGQVYSLPLATAITLPENLGGTIAYQGTINTGTAVFALRKVSGGVTTAIGTITLGTSSRTAITLPTQAAVSFVAGDVLQLVAPAIQNTTLADLGITLLAAKV